MLAVISLVLHRRRRLEESRPRLSARLSWTAAKDSPNGAIRLDLWNAGRSPVCLKKIQLMWGRENKETRETVSKLGFMPYDPVSAAPLATSSEDPLCECEGRTFMLPPLPPSIMRQALSQPEDRVWVAVESDTGELLRLKADQVLPFLRAYVERAGRTEN